MSRLNKDVKLSILHVYPVSKSHKNGTANAQPVLKDVEDRMNKLSKSLTEKSDQVIKNVVLSGNVEDTVIKFIKDNKYDLVIVGVNSNGANNEIGSHTVSMIKKSGIPVMIVPNNKGTHGAIAS